MAKQKEPRRPKPLLKGPASPRLSPDGSPGAHYAGCKWTDPPLPSSLPPPPQHWMQQPQAAARLHIVPFRPTPAHHDIEAHLKTLLKVQA